MKGIAPIFALIIVITLTFTSCFVKTEDFILKIGSMPTQSAAIYAVGVEKGFFEKHGIKVELTIFKSPLERDAAAVAGKIDGFMTDIMGLINLVDKDYKFKITSYEYEDFGIMANKQSGLKNIIEINNEEIGISENTVIEYVVDQLLDESKVKKTQVVKIPDRLAAVLGNKLQLGVFPEPFISIINANGGIEIVSSAKEGLQPVVLVYSEESIVKKDKAIKAFYSAYNEIVDYMKETPYDEYKDVLVQYGLTNEDYIDKIKLQVKEFDHAKMPTETNFNRVINWMKRKGLTTKDYKLQDVSVRRFIK